MYCTTISFSGPAAMPDTPLIQQIRTASRLMVRELGFMS
ncbi:MarR family transcriptional regulator, partial [Acinetobacter baumannii]|nr:MarR family transcriptional regulator [Acinetobacter baumannii]